MFPVALQRLRVSLRGGVALAVEFATLGEVVLEHPGGVDAERELPGENQDRSSAGRLIGEHALPAVRPVTAAARAQLHAKQPARPAAREGSQRRGTVTAVEPECAEARVRAPSREPRRRRPEPDPPFQFCTD